MGNSTQTLLGNELACDTVDAVGLVLDAYEGSLQTLDELLLAAQFSVS